MKQPRKVFLAFALLMMALTGTSLAQNFTVGGNMGLSLADGSAGFHIGAMGEYSLNRNFSLGTDFTINTQAGTPIIWWNYAKYFFVIPSSKIKPYADAGVFLDFVTGGPYFGLLFGGGANIPIAKKLSIAPELQLGPVFGVGGGTYFGYSYSGTTVFVVIIRGGIRYEI